MRVKSRDRRRRFQTSCFRLFCRDGSKWFSVLGGGGSDDGAAISRELPPFLGVPCSVKECFAVQGLPQTSGLVARKGKVATADATVVRRYREVRTFLD